MHHHDTSVALEIPAGGEPGRVIVDGARHVPGATMFELLDNDSLEQSVLDGGKGRPSARPRSRAADVREL